MDGKQALCTSNTHKNIARTEIGPFSWRSIQKIVARAGIRPFSRRSTQKKHRTDRKTGVFMAKHSENHCAGRKTAIFQAKHSENHCTDRKQGIFMAERQLSYPRTASESPGAQAAGREITLHTSAPAISRTDILQYPRYSAQDEKKGAFFHFVLAKSALGAKSASRNEKNEGIFHLVRGK